MASLQRAASGNWIAVVRIKGPAGQVFRKKTFRRKTDAQRWANEIEERIRQGREQTRVSTRRLDDLIQMWIKRRLPQLKGERHRRQRLLTIRWWSERLGNRRAPAVTTAVIARALDDLDVAPSTRNRYRSALGAVYRYAIERGELERTANPTVGLHEKENNARTRWLDDFERHRLLKTVADDPDMLLLIRLALTTAMRQGELLKMRWRDLDFTRNLIAIPDTKSGRVRSTPIHPKLRPVLLERRDRLATVSSFVFPGTNGAMAFPRKRWLAALERAEIEDFRFHDLRHTAATIQAQHGASLNELKTLLGHSTLEMVTRYTHLVDNEVAAAAERIADLAVCVAVTSAEARSGESRLA